VLSAACDSSGGHSTGEDSGDEDADAGDEPDSDAGEIESDADLPGLDAAESGPIDASELADTAPLMDATSPDDTGAGSDADAQVDATGPKLPAWTVLVYMAADNNLEKFAIDDLNEMLAADLSGEINLLVQMDRASGFYELGVGGLANWTTMKRFKVTKGKLTEVGDLGEQDTGEPQVLSEFIDWGFTTYPSEHRLLLLWNHGNAWQGYGGDDESNHDLLDQNELQQAVHDGLKGKQVDLIGFDACLMSTFVTAQAMVEHTRYYIASEEFEPGNGWDYTATLNYLSSNLAASPVDLGTRIAGDFFAQCRKEKKHADATLNLIDLSHIATLEEDFDALIEALDQSLDDRKTRVAGARTKAATFGYHSDPEYAYHMVDLGDLARRLASQDSDLNAPRDKLLATLAKMNVANKYGANKQDSSGLSIYFPTAAAFYKNGYDAVQEGTPWRDLLKKFYGLANSSQTAAPAFKGQSVSGQASSNRPRYRAPTPGQSSLTSDPVDATPACVADEGPRISSPLNSSDVTKVASSTLVSGLVEKRTGEVHVFSREPAQLDAITGNVHGTWDRHVLVANQGAQQELLFAEVELSEDERYAFASVPMLYSEPPSCRCAVPGTPGYSDVDADGRADCADGDVDGDGAPDKGVSARDNCPWLKNADQADADSDGVGDACENGSGAPTLGCTPVASGEFATLEPAFWQVTVDRLNGEKYSAALYVTTGAGASEISPLPGALLWPRGLVLKGDGALVFETGQPLTFNLQQPIEFNYLDVEKIFLLNEAGDTLLDDQLAPTRLIDRLGWGDLFMRIFVSDFAGRGGAAETQADFSSCDPPEPEFCVDPKIPDCDGRCLDPAQLLANGSCDDGTAGRPNLNCELRNFDDGECVRPGCPGGYIRDCEGKCTLREGVLGDGQCDVLAQCESLDFDRGDCPCGPDCSGHGTCGSQGCSCETGHTGSYCQTPPSCGDGSCTLADGETCSTCVADCGACTNPCGDGICSPSDGESCETCGGDCGACACGDGHCGAGEDCTSCAVDCGSCPVCGDFACSSYTSGAPFGQSQGENCAACALDCGACTGDCCVASQGTGDKWVGGGCGDLNVSQCVCAAKPECCVNGWTSECVEYAKTQCGLSCVQCPAAVGGDADADTRCGNADNCPLNSNTEQTDIDADGVGDACDVCGGSDDKHDPDRDLRPSGCDNCPSVANAAQTDSDNDGRGDLCDNCPANANAEQGDGDGDRVGDGCDNCGAVSNPDQRDIDSDGLGDVCDPCNDAVVTPDTDQDGTQDSCDADDDGDAIPDVSDNCPLLANAGQPDLDQDGLGDACDGDDDQDGVPDGSDNCLIVPNSNQVDLDQDGTGDACDGDRDGDTVADAGDNCPALANLSQADQDLDGQGDVCDADRDGDGVADVGDNCPLLANVGQADLDNDGQGDLCDADDDGDGHADGSDNCPLLANVGQSDIDQDGQGDVCDADDDADGVPDAGDNCALVANPGQADIDQDGQGDACDNDRDGDGVVDGSDNCVLVPNAGQADLDLDGIGDLCDTDRDGDSVLAGQDVDDGNRFVCRDADADGCDDCVSGAPLPGADGSDQDADGLCDVGDPDRDGDGAPNLSDNCPLVGNPGQANADGDGLGDVCDPDMDNDSVANAGDNCPLLANNDQANFDGDANGDVCDSDDDNDGASDGTDQCPFDPTRISAPQCGCFGIETDTDGDSVADCVDACPNAPASTTLPCTCPPGEQDKDNNGICVPDCEHAGLGCTGFGHCDDNSGIPVCACDPGYAGPTCASCAPGFQDNDFDGMCLPNCATSGLNCGANGSCSDLGGSPLCVCAEGYGGATCDLLVSFTQMKGGASSNDSAASIVLDGAGNSYVFISFDGGPTDYGDLAPVTSFGSSDSVIVSYSPTGATRWVRQIGGTLREDTGAIAIDGAGNLFVVGTVYSTTLNLAPGQSISSPGSYHSYVASYTSAGAYRWAKVLGNGEGYAVATDATGNVFVGGWVSSGGFDYGTGAGVQQARGAGDMFLVSYTNNGSTTRWADVFGSDGSGNGVRDIAVDPDGNLYTAMTINGSNADVGGGLLGYGGVNSTVVTASYDNSGVHRWSHSYPATGGGQTSEARSVAVGSNGSAVFGIAFTDTINFGEVPVTATNTGQFASSLLMVETEEGFPMYQRDFLDGGSFVIYDTHMDAANNVYISGNQNNGNGTLGAGRTNSGAFIASYDADFMQYRFGQIAGGGAYPIARGFGILPSGDLMVVGQTNTSVDWGAGVRVTSGGYDAWLARVNQVPVSGIEARYTALQTTTVTSSGTVSEWRDVGGRGASLVPAGSAPLFSTSLLNGRPAISFAGGKGLVSNTSLDLASDVTVFAVFTYGNPGIWGAIAHHGHRDNDWSMENNAFAGGNVMHFQSLNDNAGNDLPFNPGTSYIAVGRINGNTREFFELSAAGGFLGNSTGGSSISPNSQLLYVGKSDAGEPSNAVIGELLYYDRALSNPERDAVIAYLRGEWGL
jgi:hypothetical protein